MTAVGTSPLVMMNNWICQTERTFCTEHTYTTLSGPQGAGHKGWATGGGPHGAGLSKHDIVEIKKKIKTVKVRNS